MHDDTNELTAAERMDALRAAVAYSLANDEKSLERLGAAFTPKLKGSPEANMFAVLIQPIDLHGLAFRDAAAKMGPAKKNALDRATHWYVQAWPSLDGASKDKLRERFRKMFQSAGSIGKASPREWTMPASELKSGVSPAAARTGPHGRTAPRRVSTRAGQPSERADAAPCGPRCAGRARTGRMSGTGRP